MRVAGRRHEGRDVVRMAQRQGEGDGGAGRVPEHDGRGGVELVQQLVQQVGLGDRRPAVDRCPLAVAGARPVDGDHAVAGAQKRRKLELMVVDGALGAVDEHHRRAFALVAQVQTHAVDGHEAPERGRPPSREADEPARRHEAGGGQEGEAREDGGGDGQKSHAVIVHDRGQLQTPRGRLRSCGAHSVCEVDDGRMEQDVPDGAG